MAYPTVQGMDQLRTLLPMAQQVIEKRTGRGVVLPALPFRCSPLRPHRIAGGREVMIASDISRVIDKALAWILAKVIDPLLSPRVMGFRKGSGVHACMAYLTPYIGEVTEYDIVKFFPSVNRGRLYSLIRNLPLSVDIIHILINWLERGLPGLPTGMAISPVLANLYLAKRDRSFSSYHHVRYADNDFFIGGEPPLYKMEVMGLRVQKRRGRILERIEGGLGN